jgi:hypothetical protein
MRWFCSQTGGSYTVPNTIDSSATFCLAMQAHQVLPIEHKAQYIILLPTHLMHKAPHFLHACPAAMMLHGIGSSEDARRYLAQYQQFASQGAASQDAEVAEKAAQLEQLLQASSQQPPA